MALSKIDLANMVENQMPQSLIADNINFRNIIINGDMIQSQRSTSVSSITGSGYNTVDRWHIVLSGLGTWTQSQSTDVPTGQGFAKSLKMDCTTADASPGSGDFLFLNQKVEGQNVQYLKKGTSSAESTTLSFWVKSNKTGTYICELDDNDNTRNINKSYTINSADTWEKKEITFAGDTTGAFGNDSANSLQVIWWLGAGSNYTSGTLNNAWESTTNANRAVGQVNLADSTSNEWYVTGVQLEAGTSASDFEFLPVDVNLARCQRYYQIIADRTSTGERMAIICGAAIATGTGSGVVYAALQFPTPMRASATMLSTTVTNGYRLLGDTQPTFNVLSASPITNRGARLSNGGTLSANATSGKAYVLECELNGSNLIFSSEL
jgi:hypothetical protein